MNKSKYFFLCILTVLILFCSISEPLILSATEIDKGVKPTTEWTGIEWYQLAFYLANKIGAMGNDFSNNMIDFVENTTSPQSIRDMFNMFKAGVSVKDGKVLVSSDAMNALKDLTDAYIEDHGDFILLPTFNFYNMTEETSYLNSFQYAQTKSDVDNAYTCLRYWGSYTEAYDDYDRLHFGVDDVHFVTDLSGSYKHCLYLYDKNGDSASFPWQEVDMENNKLTIREQGNTGGWVAVPSSNYNTIGFWQLVTNDGRMVKAWKSVNALRNYIRGFSSNTTIYVSSTYNNYNVNNDNSVFIDASTAQYIFEQGDSLQVELNRVSNNVTNEINNYYVNNGQSMSAQDIQNAIDAALQKYLDSLPSGGSEQPTEPETPTETPTEPETETGGDISGNDVSGNGVDGPKTVGLLTKIYNRLTDVYLFLKGGLLDALNGIKGAVFGGAVSGNDISGNDVSGNGGSSGNVSWLEKIYDKLSEIKKAIIGNTVSGGLGDLISSGLDKLADFADSVKDSVVAVVPEVTEMVSEVINGTEETIGKMVNNFGTNMRPVGEKMKTKFPFSIPWDIAAVVSTFAAEPETPVFEVPIVFERYDIDYTLTIDLADFDVISKISRIFLSLTFVLFLTKLTIQVVKMEKEL